VKSDTNPFGVRRPSPPLSYSPACRAAATGYKAEISALQIVFGTVPRSGRKKLARGFSRGETGGSATARVAGDSHPHAAFSCRPLRGLVAIEHRVPPAEAACSLRQERSPHANHAIT
jgi:hypothetical protein